MEERNGRKDKPKVLGGKAETTETSWCRVRAEARTVS